MPMVSPAAARLPAAKLALTHRLRPRERQLSLERAAVATRGHQRQCPPPHDGPAALHATYRHRRAVELGDGRHDDHRRAAADRIPGLPASVYQQLLALRIEVARLVVDDVLVAADQAQRVFLLGCLGVKRLSYSQQNLSNSRYITFPPLPRLRIPIALEYL